MGPSSKWVITRPIYFKPAKIIMSNDGLYDPTLSGPGTASRAIERGIIPKTTRVATNRSNRGNTKSDSVSQNELVKRVSTQIKLETALVDQGRGIQAEATRADYTKIHGRPFIVDVERLADIVEAAAYQWVKGATQSNLQSLASLQSELITETTILRLQKNAREFLRQTEYRLEPEEFQPLKPDYASPVEIRGARERNTKIQLHALARISDPQLQLLYLHPHRSSVIRRLANDAVDGTRALESLMIRAYDANREFFAEIKHQHENRIQKRQRSHVWRYPPIIMGGLRALQLSDHQDVVRFCLESIAPVRAGISWNQLFLVAGIALAGAALVATGPIGAIIAGIDIALAGMETYRGYVIEMQNVLATQAGAMPNTLRFTNRTSDFGNVALAGAATLVSGFAILRGGLNVFAQPRIRPKKQVFSAQVPEPTGIKNAAQTRSSNRLVNANGVNTENKLTKTTLSDESDSLSSVLERHTYPPTEDEPIRAATNLRKFAPLQMEKISDDVGDSFLPPTNRTAKGGNTSRAANKKTRRARELKRFRELDASGIQPTAEAPLPRPRQHTFTRAEQLTGIPLDEAYRRSLRGKTPTKQLQQWAQRQLKVGDPDPAFPGLRVDGPAQADHIVAMERIRLLDGFAELTEPNQLKVLNMKENFAALSPQANRSKGAKSYSEWFRHQDLNVPVDEGFRKSMLAREQELIPMIQNKIAELLEKQARRL